MTYTLILFFLLFLMALGFGYLIDGKKEIKVGYLETPDNFTIYYDQRRIVVSGKKNVRLCTYSWKGKFESITFPLIDGDNKIERIEHFISRYKTSMLTKYLFDFSSMNNPVFLLSLDPFHGKELSEIQLKLKSYIRNC